MTDFIILQHSSKTMDSHAATEPTSLPRFGNDAATLQSFIADLPIQSIQKSMKISETLATDVRTLARSWPTSKPVAAIDAFRGDIYSGLRAALFNKADRLYAQDHLVILSGLYGILRPLDGIVPYRLEIGYTFPGTAYKSLYAFWGDRIAKTLEAATLIVNTSSGEYTKSVLPHLRDVRVVTPQFLTISSKTGEPVFVTVHTKIARGTFAGWLIRTRIQEPLEFEGFTELGYLYDASRSTVDSPVFICQTFGGLGLSVRSKK